MPRIKINYVYMLFSELLIRTIVDNFDFFFFSSRRRHTRSLCDWSSDVCSSDLRYFLLGVIFTRTDTRVESSHQGTPQNKNKSFSFHFQTARAFGPGLLILL